MLQEKQEAALGSWSSQPGKDSNNGSWGPFRYAKALEICSEVMKPWERFPLGNHEGKVVSREAFRFASGRKDMQSLCTGGTSTFLFMDWTLFTSYEQRLVCSLMVLGWICWAKKRHVRTFREHSISHPLCIGLMKRFWVDCRIRGTLDFH